MCENSEIMPLLNFTAKLKGAFKNYTTGYSRLRDLYSLVEGLTEG
jgi:hypothetical protein